MSYTPGTWESGARIHSTGREAYRKPKTPRMFEPITACDRCGEHACTGCGTTGFYGDVCASCRARAEAKPIKSATFGGVPIEGATGYVLTPKAPWVPKIGERVKVVTDGGAFGRWHHFKRGSVAIVKSNPGPNNWRCEVGQLTCSCSLEDIAPLVEETEPQECDGWKLDPSTDARAIRWLHKTSGLVHCATYTTDKPWFSTRLPGSCAEAQSWPELKAALIAAGVLK